MTFDTPAYLLYWMLVLAPALPYVALNLSYRRILTRKIDEAAARLTEETKAAYAKAYGDTNIKKALRNFYHWTTYIAPVVLTSVIAATFTAVALAITGLPLPGLPDLLVRKMATAPLSLVAGALGAYLFGLDEMVRRHGTADLSSSALHTTWVRIAMSSGVGAVLNGMGMPERAAIPLAFAVGTLPLSAIWSFVREKAQLKVDEGKYWESDLYLLEGLTQSARDRLFQEDIDSVQRLSCSDPVRLLFRTNIEWNVILDLLDQALLVNFVGEKIVSLRPLGIRGSIEMSDIFERSPEQGNTAAEIAHGKRMLDKVGRALGSDANAAYNIGYVLSNDPLVQFIWAQWNSVYPLGDEEEQTKQNPAGQLPPPVRGGAYPPPPPPPEKQRGPADGRD